MPETIVTSSPETILHDGTFEGLLSAVFEAVRLRLCVERVESASGHVPELFEAARTIPTRIEQARRVWDGTVKRGGPEIAAMVHGAFLSELAGIDTSIWNFLRKLFSDAPGRGKDVFDKDVHDVWSAAQKTMHEAPRLEGFVRFQKAPAGSLFSVIAPDHDIVGLLAPHFLERFPGEAWLIADSRRGRCLHSDGTTTRVSFCDPSSLPKSSGEAARWAAPEESGLRDLWLTYYDSVNIAERRNARNMARQLPRKYWKYLPERELRNPGKTLAA
jgi:probable DNA metabolism protein